jgi:hypothetical protein
MFYLKLIKHCPLKTYGVVEVQLQAFLTRLYMEMGGQLSQYRFVTTGQNAGLDLWRRK